MGKIDELIERLRGTCDSLDVRAEELGLDPMDTELCARVDQEIFCCTICGWWCDQDEADEFGAEEWSCRDCLS